MSVTRLPRIGEIAFGVALLLLVWYPFGVLRHGALARPWERLHDAVVAALLLGALPGFMRVVRTRGPWFRDLPLLYLTLCAVSVIPLLWVPTLGFGYVRMQWANLATWASVFSCAYMLSRHGRGAIVGVLVAWLSWAGASALDTIVGAARRGTLVHDAVTAMGHTNSRAGAELGIGLIMAGIALRGTGRARIAASAFAALLGASLVLGLSRGAWLGVAVGAVVAACLTGGWKRAVVLIIGCAVVVALLPGRVGERARSVFDPSFPTNEFRITTWRATARVIARNPWAGVGYDTLWFSLLAHLGSEVGTLAGRHVHNLFLQTWAETGLLGAGALIGVWCALFWCAAAIARQGSPGHVLAWGALLGLSGMAGHALVDCTWRDYGTQALFWGLGGWLVAEAEGD